MQVPKFINIVSVFTSKKGVFCEKCISIYNSKLYQFFSRQSYVYRKNVLQISCTQRLSFDIVIIIASIRTLLSKMPFFKTGCVIINMRTKTGYCPCYFVLMVSFTHQCFCTIIVNVSTMRNINNILVTSHFPLNNLRSPQ